MCVLNLTSVLTKGENLDTHAHRENACDIMAEVRLMLLPAKERQIASKPPGTRTCRGQVLPDSRQKDPTLETLVLGLPASRAVRQCTSTV